MDSERLQELIDSWKSKADNRPEVDDIFVVLEYIKVKRKMVTEVATTPACKCGRQKELTNYKCAVCGLLICKQCFKLGDENDNTYHWSCLYQSPYIHIRKR